MRSPVRFETYVVLGVMFACFAILYPKIIHPTIMRWLWPATERKNQEHFPPPHFNPAVGSRPRTNSPDVSNFNEPSTTNGLKRGGLMTIILPMYAVGIVIYLVYTLSKVYKSRKRKGKPGDKYLQQYYRNFHYDADRGQFRMDHDSSEEESSYRSPDHSTRRSYTKHASDAGRFDWASTYGDQNFPDIYRSAKSLPRDLEQLLTTMENKDVDGSELSQLRSRLEQTEKEMMRILHTVDRAEGMFQHNYSHTCLLKPRCTPNVIDPVESVAAEAGSRQSSLSDSGDDNDRVCKETEKVVVVEVDEKARRVDEIEAEEMSSDYGIESEDGQGSGEDEEEEEEEESKEVLVATEVK